MKIAPVLENKKPQVSQPGVVLRYVNVPPGSSRGGDSDGGGSKSVLCKEARNRRDVCHEGLSNRTIVIVITLADRCTAGKTKSKAHGQRSVGLQATRSPESRFRSPARCPPRS